MECTLLECFVLLCYQLCHRMKEIQFRIAFRTEIIDTLSAVVLIVKDLPIFQFRNLKFDTLPLSFNKKQILNKF